MKRTWNLYQQLVDRPPFAAAYAEAKLAACQLAGIEPAFEVWEGDPVARVLSANNERRHLSTGQRAMATALTLAADGRRRNGRWKRDSLPAGNGESPNSTWQARMKRAGAVLDHAPDLAAEVAAGETALSAAYEQAEDGRDREARPAHVRPGRGPRARHTRDHSP